MKKTIKSKRIFGVFVTFAIVLAGILSAGYYYVLSNTAKEDRPPELNLGGTFQAFSKEGLQGFLKFEESDETNFQQKYGNSNKKSIILKEGINYVYVDKQTEIIDIIECIDPVAERILIAQYKPEDKVFYTFPKGPFGAETEEFASIHQKLNPTEGFIVISRREAKAYCIKEPKLKAENNADEPTYGGWTLVASNDDNVKELVKDFEQRVKTAWIMEDIDTFEKAPSFDTALKDYYLVWLNMDAKPCVPEKEPHTVFMNYVHAIGNKEFDKLFKELPPSYQASLKDLVNKEFKEILDNAKVKEIAPKASSIFKALAEAVNTRFEKVLTVIPQDLIPQDKKDQAKAAVVDALNFAASVVDLLNKLAIENPINLENILATDIVLLLAQAEGVADKIAADDLYPGFKEYYSEYKKYLSLFKNITATAKDTQLEKATVTVKFGIEDLPKAFKDSPEKEEATLIRVVEEDGSCYWVPDGLPQIKNEIDTSLKPELKKIADDINNEFTLSIKAQTIDSLTDLEKGVQDFNSDGRACEFIGKSLTAYADLVGAATDEEIAVEVKNVTIDPAVQMTLISKPVRWKKWDLVAGPFHGKYEDSGLPAELESKKYIHDAGYIGEDWILYGTRDFNDDEGGLLVCLAVGIL